MKYKKRKEIFFDSETILASIPRRLFAMALDFVIIILFFFLTIFLLKLLGINITHLDWKEYSHVEIEATNISDKSLHDLKIALGLFPILYFVLTTYFANGQTLGKKIMGIRIVSVYHHRIGLWHCIERSLGYAASTLEMGIGFIQVFWNPNRMALHDRIAETMVIRVKRNIKEKPGKIKKQKEFLKKHPETGENDI